LSRITTRTRSNSLFGLLSLGVAVRTIHDCQDGFGTFGGPHILSLVTEVATRALKAVWYQKWSVRRRLRPEAMAGLVHPGRHRQEGSPVR